MTRRATITRMSYRRFLPAWFRAWLRDLIRPYEPDVCEALGRHVRRGMVVADVGANRGYFSLRLAQLVGRRGHVIVVEALPTNAALIRRRARRRLRGSRVEVIHAAATDANGQIDLYPGRELNPGQWNPGEWTLDQAFGARTDTKPMDRRPISVPGRRLDELLAGRNVEVIKLDVEGAEEHVVRGMSRLLQSDQPVVVLERHGEPGTRAIAALVEAGYQIESTSGQPLGADTTEHHVVARRH